MAKADYNHTFISRRDNRIMTCAVCGATKQVGSSQSVAPVCYSVDEPEEAALSDDG